MAINGSRSTFNEAGGYELDVFQEMFDLSPALLSDAQEYKTLLVTENKTQEQLDRFNTLTTELQNYIMNAEKWNKFLDCLYNMENFMKTNVEDYVLSKQAEFDATLQKFTNRGLWSELTPYVKWNTVSYNYETYLSLQDGNLNHTPSGDINDLWWQKMAQRGIQGVPGIGLSWSGAYNNSVTYSVGNAVNYENSIYYCINASTGNIPTNTSYWQLFMSNTGIAIQSTAPLTPFVHMVWIDTSTIYNNIKYWDGVTWQICGIPASKVSISDSENQIESTNVDDALDEIFTKVNEHTSKSTSISDSLLTTTSATNVLTFTPTVQGNFNIGIYFRVVTGTTNVTVNVTYTDGTGSQTNNVLPIQSCTIGSYSTLPLFINAKTTSAITIQVTASVANRVYVSASIQGV